MARLNELASTFQRLTVEGASNARVSVDLRASTALESNCLTSIFYQPSLKELSRSGRTVRARSVWFAAVACDLWQPRVSLSFVCSLVQSAASASPPAPAAAAQHSQNAKDVLLRIDTVSDDRRQSCSSGEAHSRPALGLGTKQETILRPTRPLDVFG